LKIIPTLHSARARDISIKLTSGKIVDRPSQALQDQFLKSLQKHKTPVSIFLVNGIRLHGHVEFFDNYIVAVRSTGTQLVYKHAISTIIPAGSEDAHPGHGKQLNAKPGVIVRTKPSRAAALKDK
jgi:host factor-I protein